MTMSMDSSMTIYEACYQGQLQLVKHLVETTPSLIYKKDDDERQPLHWAASGGHVIIVEYLLQDHPSNGVDVNAQDEAGWTPLHIAVSCGHDEVVRCLLAHEADVHARTENGLTALHYAASKNRLECAKVLVERGADGLAVDSRLKQTCAHRAAGSGHLPLLKYILSVWPSLVKQVDGMGQTCLHVACEGENSHLAVWLVEEGDAEGLVHLKDKEGKTPLDRCSPGLKAHLLRLLE